MKKIVFLLFGLLFFISNLALSQMQADFSTTINTICDGSDCDYEGPTILINEIMIAPLGNIDGSLSGNAGINSGRGEWIELYNPHLCEAVDISCYYLGNAAPGSGLFGGVVGGGFQLPEGTVVPPAGFCLVRGINAAAVPSNLLVENGGNVVEVIVPGNITDDGVCVEEDSGGGFFPPIGGDGRLWFPNSGGWFAFYDEAGVPQDAISWGTEEGGSTQPCVPVHSTCNTGVTSLASYTNIPTDRREKIYNGAISTSAQTVRRIPDGGPWAANQTGTATPGDCNENCAEVGTSSCDGTATVNVTGGSGNYSYLWNDTQAQATQTAVGLCAGSYEVIVTDNDLGQSQTFTVSVEDLVVTYASNNTNPSCGQSNGEIILNPENGTAPYLYSIDEGDNFQTNQNFSGQSAGSYAVVITDDNGCVGEGNELLNDQGDFDIGEVVITDPSCSTICDGHIDVVVSGGGTFTLELLDANDQVVATDNLTDLCVGEYTVLVIDDIGCTASESVVLTSGSAADASFSFDDFCEGEENSAFDISTPGGMFEFVPAVSDGAVINPLTGEITNGVGGTVYTLVYHLTGDCPSTFELDVTVFETPEFTLSQEDPDCGENNGVIIISGLANSADYTLVYDYNGAATNSQSVTANATGEIILSNSAEGTYSNISITDATGCEYTNPTTIGLFGQGAPTVSAPADFDICLGESMTLTASNPDGADISWDNGVVDGVAFTPTTSGTFTYTVTATVDDCLVTDIVTVVVHDSPTVNAGEDQVICEGSSVTLTASGAQSYQWSDNVTNGSSFIPNETTTYTVFGTDAFGCMNSDEVTVSVLPYPEASFEGDDLLGCEPHTVNFTNLTTYPGGLSCLWSFGDGTTSTDCNPSHVYSSAGLYDVTLTVTNSAGCSNVISFSNYIQVIPAPVASFIANPTTVNMFNPEVNFINNSENATDFTWDFGDQSTQESSYHSSHIYDGTSGDYVVTLTASNGMEECDDVMKFIITVEEELIYYVPNSFTPDNDLYNEVFKPIFSSGFDPLSYTLLIYNRWGELLFESHDTEVGWDGSYGLNMNFSCKEGTYVWKIRIKEKGKDKHNEYIGHINLLK